MDWAEEKALQLRANIDLNGGVSYALIIKALREARAEALEEAANTAERDCGEHYSCDCHGEEVTELVAKAIRALAEKERNKK